MTDTMRYTILGCGSSPGTPRINGDWGDCDPKEPKNRRLRCSLLVERISDSGTTRAVIDTSPDFRQQMLNANVSSIDGVVFTHPHADHVHGIDDLRGYALAQRERIRIFADDHTLARLNEGFGYCFQTPEGSMYPPILDAATITPGKVFTVDGDGGPIGILPILQEHGPIHSLGFRFQEFENGGVCYSPDISGLPDASVAMLDRLDCWIVDALQYKPHVSHFSVSDTLEWIKKLKPQRSILTHMHIPLDYQTLRSELPVGVEPGYDGMIINL